MTPYSPSCRTLSDLPPELLHGILRLVQDRYALKSVALLSRYLRSIALEYAFCPFVTVRGSTSFPHFAQFLRQYPRIAASIQRIVLNDLPSESPAVLHDGLLLSIFECTPSVNHLQLTAIHFAEGPTSSPAGCLVHQDPFPLETLSLGWDHAEQSTLTSIFRTLSLFDIDHLDTLLVRWNFSPEFDASRLHRRLRIRSIEVGRSPDSPEHMVHALNAFRESLEPGILTSLQVAYDSAEAMHAIGEFLSEHGRGLETLGIRCRRPAQHPAEESQCWRDPIEGGVHALALESCVNLVHFALHIYHCPGASSAVITPTHIDLISHLPATLQSITFTVYGISIDQINAGAPFGFNALDGALLSPQFPDLHQVKLEILVPTRNSGFQIFNRYGCRARVLGELSGLEAAGMLEVVV